MSNEAGNATSDNRVTCADCGANLGADPGAPSAEPCSNCGSTRRNISETLEVTATTRVGFSAKAKSPHEKKPLLEEKVGPELFRKLARWRFVERLIDRRGNRYFERIVDEETGKVVREIDEPLTKHVGRGSAKRKAR